MPEMTPDAAQAAIKKPFTHPYLQSLAMTFLDMLRDATERNHSLLCVGLDPEPAKFPTHWRGDASKIFDFCAAMVDATADVVCAFKPQIAYFAAHGAEAQLEKLMAHMRSVAPQVPVILDSQARRYWLYRRAVRERGL